MAADYILEQKIDRTFMGAMSKVDALQKVFRNEGLLAKAVVDIGGDSDFTEIQEACNELYDALERGHHDGVAHLGANGGNTEESLETNESINTLKTLSGIL